MSDQQIQQQKQAKRLLPSSDIDFNMLVTDPTWGRQEDVNISLRNTLAKEIKIVAEDPQGNKKRLEFNVSAWDLLDFYKRDLRLGNLRSKTGKNPFQRDDVEVCEFYLNLAGDFLECKLYKPFLICLRRVITTLELSHSRGGFFRRLLQTFRTENVTQQINPPKKSMFGGGAVKK